MVDKFLLKVICNTFSILDWSMNTVASGLYLLPSLLNHSCTPNCVLVYNGPQLSLRTIKDVKLGGQVNYHRLAIKSDPCMIICLLHNSYSLVILSYWRQRRGVVLTSAESIPFNAAVSVVMEKMR